jgi:hypothetical protein
MKKLVLALAALSASAANAAFIQCAPTQGTVVNDAAGQAIQFTCSPGGENTALDGLLITQIRLRASGTFQENNASSAITYAVQLAVGAASGPGWSVAGFSVPITQTSNAGGQALGAGSSTTAFSPVAGSPDSLPAFIVTITGGAGSTPLPFNASASLFYEVTTTNSAIPEPSTVALLGSALLGLGLFGRRWQ